MKQAEDRSEVVYKPTTVSELPQRLKIKNEKQKDTCLFLYVASLIVNVTPFMVGMAQTWVSPVSLKLLSPDPSINPLEIPITPFQLSLIGSLPAVSGVVGLLLLGNLFDVYGRKKILIVVLLVTVIFYVTVAYATNIYFYYIPLIILGMALGVGMSGTAMYTSELTEDHNRAQFSCLIGLGIPLGNLAAFVIGPFCSVKVLSLLCAFPSTICIACFVTLLPESPVFLISKGDMREAEKALMKFRNKSPREIAKEIETIEFVLKQTSKYEKTGLIPLVKNRTARKALIICILISACWLSVIPAINSFMNIIFNEAGTDISGFISTIVVASVQVFVCIGASMTVEIFGRRQLLLVSSLASSLPLFALCIFFHLKSQDSPILESLWWLPVLSLVIFFFFSTVGLGTVPMVFISEVVPNNVKSTAMSIILSINFLIVGIAIFFFPLIMANLGLVGNFGILGMICLLGFIFIYCFMPETKGKSLLEIQAILAN